MNRHERRKQAAIKRRRGLPKRFVLNVDEDYANKHGMQHGEIATIEGSKREYVINVVTDKRPAAGRCDWLDGCPNQNKHSAPNTNLLNSKA